MTVSTIYRTLKTPFCRRLEKKLKLAAIEEISEVEVAAAKVREAHTLAVLEDAAAADLVALKIRQAEHSVELKQHAKVIEALELHLKELVVRFSSMEKKLIIVGVVIFSGTEQGAKLLTNLTSLVH